MINLINYSIMTAPPPYENNYPSIEELNDIQNQNQNTGYSSHYVNIDNNKQTNNNNNNNIQYTSSNNQNYQQPMYVQQQPVYVQQQPVYVQQPLYVQQQPVYVDSRKRSGNGTALVAGLVVGGMLASGMRGPRMGPRMGPGFRGRRGDIIHCCEIF